GGEPMRRHLVAALLECLVLTPKEAVGTEQWLFAALDMADNDPWRVRVRKAGRGGDFKELERLIREADISKQPPSFLILVTHMIPKAMRSARLELLRRIQRAYPADLWANHELAWALKENGQPAEAVRYYTAALALRPDNAGIYLNRGSALRDAGELDAAIRDYRAAIQIEPKYARAYNHLSGIFYKQGKLGEAIATLRQA